MLFSHSQNLSRHFVSSAISCILVILLCTPFTPLVAAYNGSIAKNNEAANMPLLQTKSFNFLSLGFGDFLDTKRHGFMNNVNFLEANTNALFQYGLDGDGVPFAQKADGTKGRFVAMSPSHFRLQVVRERKIGEVEFIRLSSDETTTLFRTGEGDGFFIHTKTKIDKKGTTRTNIDFRYNNKNLSLNLTFSPTDDGTGKVQQRQVVDRLLLPSH